MCTTCAPYMYRICTWCTYTMRPGGLLNAQVAFLGTLPALNLSAAYLSSLAHCFHAVSFEPREALVRQGELADCMYVVKAGQARL